MICHMHCLNEKEQWSWFSKAFLGTLSSSYRSSCRIWCLVSRSLVCISSSTSLVQIMLTRVATSFHIRYQISSSLLHAFVSLILFQKLFWIWTNKLFSVMQNLRNRVVRRITFIVAFGHYLTVPALLRPIDGCVLLLISESHGMSNSTLQSSPSIRYSSRQPTGSSAVLFRRCNCLRVFLAL